MNRRVLALLPVPILAAALVTCGPGGGASRDPLKYNVLIVVLDALRADKLGCYGFENDTSPRIDAFSRDPDSVLYENHYAQAPFTKTSTASLFTGLFPTQHGVLSGHNRGTAETWREVTTPVLDDAHRTMAERLERQGFYTFGVVKSRHLVADYGFDQGFQDYFSPQHVKGDDNRLEKTLECVEQAPERFFGYVHLSATHHPYPSDGRDPAYMAEHGFPYDEDKRQAAGVDFTTPDIKHLILDGDVRLEPKDVDFLHLVYEATTKRVDDELFGELIDGLKEEGVYDSTMIVLTADHGEELYDHEGYAHAHHVWDEILRVPMVVKFPKGLRPEKLGDRVSEISSTIDVLPSILAFGGEEAIQDLPGVPLFRGRTQGFALGEQISLSVRRWALVRKKHKLIFSQDSVEDGLTSEAGAGLLFDLKEDPRESVDLAGENEDVAKKMAAFARAVLTGAPGLRTEAPVISTDLDQEAIDELRQLGYIK